MRCAAAGITETGEADGVNLSGQCLADGVAGRRCPGAAAGKVGVQLLQSVLSLGLSRSGHPSAQPPAIRPVPRGTTRRATGRDSSGAC